MDPRRERDRSDRGRNGPAPRAGSGLERPYRRRLVRLGADRRARSRGFGREARNIRLRQTGLGRPAGMEVVGAKARSASRSDVLGPVVVLRRRSAYRRPARPSGQLGGSDRMGRRRLRGPIGLGRAGSRRPLSTSPPGGPGVSDRRGARSASDVLQVPRHRQEPLSRFAAS